MTLKNISDSSLEELTKQLPKDAKIIKVVSLDENTSEIEVLYQEENIKLPLSKVEVSEVLGGSLGEIKVNRNTSPKKALEQFLKLNGLDLIPNVDYYVPSDDPEELNDFLDLTILETSITLKGNYTFRVRKSSKEEHLFSAKCPTCSFKAKIFLNGKIFTNKDNYMFKDYALTEEFLDELVILLEDKPFRVKPTKEMLTGLKYKEKTADSISELAIFDTKEMGELVIRFRTPKKDRTTKPNRGRFKLSERAALVVDEGEANLERKQFKRTSNISPFSKEDYEEFIKPIED